MPRAEDYGTYEEYEAAVAAYEAAEEEYIEEYLENARNQ